jgi:hypothetical protein
MELRAAVEIYLTTTGSFGEPMLLDRFGLTQKQIETLLSAWEEDYHLNRHFELIPASGMPAPAPAYRVNGTLYTAIVFRETIRDVLD